MRFRRKPHPILFKWRHFEPEIMDERGLKISHTTSLRWGFRFFDARPPVD